MPFCSEFFFPSRLLFKNLNIKIHKAIILPVVLYGLVTLRESCRLTVYENGMLRKIFEPMGVEAA
jgi:hypothetical protein